MTAPTKLPPDKEDRGGFPEPSPDPRPDRFLYIPYDPQLVEKARENRRNMTEPERLIWQRVLRDKQFDGHKFHRQKPLDRFIVDFYCPALLLAVEIDGDSHAEQKEYDELRTQRLGEFGIMVIRYTNEEVMKNLEGVFEDLARKIAERKQEIENDLPETPPSPLVRGVSESPP